MRTSASTAVSEKFKCPNCGSGRTRPVTLIIESGIRTRRTVGVSSRRSVWGSTSTYKSKLIDRLGSRPSNRSSNFCIALGVLGVLLAVGILSSGGSDAQLGSAIFGVPAAILLVVGFGGRLSAEKLRQAQAAWDNQWFCSRCGTKWIPS